MGYNVGDYVRIKDDIEPYGVIVSGMYEQKGKKAKVIEVDKSKWYRLEIINPNASNKRILETLPLYHWPERALEPYIEKDHSIASITKDIATELDDVLKEQGKEVVEAWKRFIYNSTPPPDVTPTTTFTSTSSGEPWTITLNPAIISELDPLEVYGGVTISPINDDQQKTDLFNEVYKILGENK